MLLRCKINRSHYQRSHLNITAHDWRRNLFCLLLSGRASRLRACLDAVLLPQSCQNQNLSGSADSVGAGQLRGEKRVPLHWRILPVLAEFGGRCRRARLGVCAFRRALLWNVTVFVMNAISTTLLCAVTDHLATRSSFRNWVSTSGRPHWVSSGR